MIKITINHGSAAENAKKLAEGWTNNDKTT